MKGIMKIAGKPSRADKKAGASLAISIGRSEKQPKRVRHIKMIYYIVGVRFPEGSTKESEITHYKVTLLWSEAIMGAGDVISKEDFIRKLRPGDKVFGYNYLTGKMWGPLELALDY